ncbi:MAG: anthranilate phosphoribosyltransferase family protein [Cyanobacteria bacterium P01_H01_bin.121]
MSTVFRELLRRVGSGTHTSKSLSRADAALAARLMLEQDATPAQIGAFLIAHRIKRPTSEELAGMLDTYHDLGGKLATVAGWPPPLVMGIPYDGRTRTAPISPLTALVVAAAGYPVLQHGSGSLPTKYGVPLIELWQGLGVDWFNLSLAQVQHVFEQTKLGFVYQPEHFPLAEGLVTYRNELGKRPPIATLELMWSPYAGDAIVAAGFVHPPTEKMITEALRMQGYARFLTVKGLEGSCDLPLERVAIIGSHHPDGSLERLKLHSRDYNLATVDLTWQSTDTWIKQAQAFLAETSPSVTNSFYAPTLWNSGFFLWQVGQVNSLSAGIALTHELLTAGKVQRLWQTLQNALAACRLAAPVR